MNHVIHYTVPAKNLAAEAEASERVQTKFTGQFANSVVGRAVQESRIPVDTVGSIKSVRIEDENRELPQLLKFINKMQKQGFLVIMMMQNQTYHEFEPASHPAASIKKDFTTNDF
ncbi:hypothetical protein K435DRAFT_793113 [Dendrothele bispora CBS 962.96]|uniref:Uncharacterized protein n=1 Tax=Dendrothele bispora (strain CBS 962.96) TaxID=1314807 RepID=A0A4V4HH88_DENBC|nr:hypothetical protein K435DRAFT_793113 [Dendrothele bispora CBS 962.96]